MATEEGSTAAAKKKIGQAGEWRHRRGRERRSFGQGEARNTTRSAKAVRAARAGRVDEARELVEAADLDEGMATRAVAEAEERHYQAEGNKRGLSVTALTKTLNDR